MEITDHELVEMAKEISMPLGIVFERLIYEKNDEIHKLRSTVSSLHFPEEKEENP